MRKLNVNDDPELEKENFLFEEEENRSNHTDYDYGINKGSVRQTQKQKNTEYTRHERDNNNEYESCNQMVSKWSDKGKHYNKFANNNNSWNKTATRYSRFGSFRDKQRGFHKSSLNSGQEVIYLLFFIVLAVLFRWIILKNTGMTAVALFVIIIVVVGHLRDK